MSATVDSPAMARGPSALRADQQGRRQGTVSLVVPEGGHGLVGVIVQVALLVVIGVPQEHEVFRSHPQKFSDGERLLGPNRPVFLTEITVSGKTYAALQPLLDDGGDDLPGNVNLVILMRNQDEDAVQIRHCAAPPSTTSSCESLEVNEAGTTETNATKQNSADMPI